MKKKLMVMSVLFMTLITLTGCGGKKLTCTMEEDGEKGTITANFKNDKVTTMKAESVEEYDTEEAANQAKQMADAVAGLAASSTEYMTIETKVNGKKLTTIMTIDITKMTDEEIKNQLEDADLSYDGIKKQYEDEGFKCK